jgi:hypothetical protein
MVRLIALVAALLLAATAFAGLDPSYSEKAVIDTVPFYPGGTYDRSIPEPNEYLQHPLGFWPLRYHELIPYLNTVASKSDRVVLEKFGETYEGRPLFNLFISSPANIRKLDSLREAMARLANLEISASELDAYVASLPAVAWLGYSIHGDEISGVDAGARLVYQLAAGTDEATTKILDNVIVIVVPSENPDGRERYVSMLQTYKSNVPNYNRRAMQHQGVWPWGRGNHYLFDLNRDWILLTQTETIGKVKTIQKWHPQLAVDVHEMGSNGTFLFSPPREPINYNIPNNVLKWYDTFAAEQAAAFDRNGWPYYTGEWNDQWYPGYGSAWPTYFGVVGILYEMAGTDGTFVKQQDDYILTFHEAVNKQFTSSFVNLRTLADHRTDVLKDYYNSRMNIVERGRQSDLKFLIVPDSDQLKTKRFIESLVNQGIQVQKATGTFTVGQSVDIYGGEVGSKEFPAGTYVISTAQVNGALAKAVLDFDPKLKTDFLQEERREIEKEGETKMYEISTWSTPLAYNMDAYRTTAGISVALEPVTEVKVTGGTLHNPEAQFGFIVDMAGEKTYQMLSRLFGKDLVIYASEKAFTIEGKDFLPGALVLRRRGNPDDLPEILETLAGEVDLDVYGVNTGMSTEGSHLGAPTFHLLSKPKVAIVAGDGVDYSGFGAEWFAIDRQMEYPHSIVNLSDLGYMGLDQYNVLIVPGTWGAMSRYIGKAGEGTLKKWVENGGTLILSASAAVWAADSSTGLSNVALRRQVLDKLDEYTKALERERQAESPTVDTLALWHPEKVPPKEAEQKDEKGASKISKDEDEWQRKFFPRGVFLKANVDSEDWLAFGMKGSLPVMVYSRHAFMSKPPVRTVARYADENDVRASGLLWPEARQRWASTAAVTHERKGSGQIILFADDPNMRAYLYGTRQMFLNAMLYGPGMGTRFDDPYTEQ